MHLRSPRPAPVHVIDVRAKVPQGDMAMEPRELQPGEAADPSATQIFAVRN